MPAMEALAEAVATAAHAADEGAQWLLQVSAAEQQAARCPPAASGMAFSLFHTLSSCFTWTCTGRCSISGCRGP